MNGLLAYPLRPWERVLYTARPEGLPALRLVLRGWPRGVGWAGALLLALFKARPILDERLPWLGASGQISLLLGGLGMLCLFYLARWRSREFHFTSDRLLVTRGAFGNRPWRAMFWGSTMPRLAKEKGKIVLRVGRDRFVLEGIPVRVWRRCRRFLHVALNRAHSSPVKPNRMTTSRRQPIPEQRVFGRVCAVGSSAQIRRIPPARLCRADHSQPAPKAKLLAEKLGVCDTLAGRHSILTGGVGSPTGVSIA